MGVQLINNLWQFLLALVLLEGDHNTAWCSEIQSFAVLQTSGMSLHLDGYFCTHNSFSNLLVLLYLKIHSRSVVSENLMAVWCVL